MGSKYRSELDSLRRLGSLGLIFAAAAVLLGISLSVMLSDEIAVRRFSDEAERAGAEFSVDDRLILAVIRVESGGRVRARSPKGAVGLMQLMPATAEELARELHMGDVSGPALEDPETNIRLGTYYLSKLDKRFRGDRMLALAAYNAGPAKVAAWEKEYPELSGKELIDAAAYPETRSFVRAVIRRTGA